MFLGIAKTDDIPGPDVRGNPGPDIPGPNRIFLENEPDEVAHNIENDPDIVYYFIDDSADPPVLQLVSIKAGARREARVMEIAELEAGGVDICDAEIERD
jgi:hypothetical protein